MQRQRIKYSLLRAHVVVRITNKIWHRLLADYLKKFHQKACSTCGTIILSHSTNRISDFGSQQSCLFNERLSDVLRTLVFVYKLQVKWWQSKPTRPDRDLPWMPNLPRRPNAAWQRPPTDLFKVIFADSWKTYQKKMETKFAKFGREKKNASDWFNVKHAFAAYRVELRSTKKGPWPFFSIPCLFLHWYF